MQKKMKKLALIFICLIFSSFISYVPNTGSASPAQAGERTVLAELFTGTWCKYCQGAEGAMDRLANEYPRTKLTLIEWHIDDDYKTVDNSGSEREKFYDIRSYPTAYFDGLDPSVGGSENPDDEQLYKEYKTKIEKRLNVSSPLSLSTTGYIEGSKAKITAEIKALKDPVKSNLWVHFVLYNDHNETVYVEGREYRLRYTALKSDGEHISLSKGSSVILSKNFTLQAGWDRDKLGVVTFVQTHNKDDIFVGIPPRHQYTAEVLQSNDFRFINAQVKVEKTVTEVGVGGTASFNVVLKNSRDETDNYTLRLLKYLPPNWTAHLCVEEVCYSSEASLTLAAQKSKMINISVKTAEAGTGAIELIVTSTLAPEGKSSVIFKAFTVSAPTPVRLSKTEVSKNTVTLSWSRNTDKYFLRYEVHQGTIANFTVSNDTLVVSIAHRSKTSYKVIGLHPNTNYYFKIIVVNEYGESISNEVQVKTKGEKKEKPLIPGFQLLWAAGAILLVLILRRTHEKN